MNGKLKVLDLFSGVGGMSCGFRKAGFYISGAIEADEIIANSMKLNHGQVKMFVGDIAKLEPKYIESKIGSIDVIVGGPPCQGFSLKGQRLGLNDKRNFLFREYFKYVEHFKPKYLVLENVVGMKSTDNGSFVKEILKTLKDLGYSVDHKVINSVDFGVPQNRKRLFFLGSKGKKVFLPSKTNLNIVTVWDAISDLSYLDSGEGGFKSEYKKKPKSDYQKNMRKNSKALYNHQATNHSIVTIDRLKRIPAEKGKEYLNERISSTFGQTWGRLEKDRPSPTIITRFDTPSNGKNSHPYLNRAITPREAARIQSFPDCFVFHGNKSSVIKQIGNAVPPILSEKIARSILKQDRENFNSIKKCIHLDAIKLLREIKNNQVTLMLTDIPYEHVNKKSNGLREIDKKDANRKTFILKNFLNEVFRVTKGSGYIFCGKEQVSEIFDFFNKKNLTTRLMIWEKTNPSPMNCQHTWMSGIETFIYFKKRQATYNEHYKNSVLRFPNGSSKEHPTEKPLKLFEYLIRVSTNKGDLICDPCVGSGTTAVAAERLERNYIVGDISKKYLKVAKRRIENEVNRII